MADPGKEKRKERRKPNLHPILYPIIRAIVRPIVALKFKFKLARIDIDGPFLLMVNHNNNWDPVFLGAVFKQYPYYVASEHITRWGFMSRLLDWLFKPIIRAKGKTESATAKTIIKTLRGGASVCIFAEGNRSANGETCPILPSTAKLARRSGAKLVTYRFRGGYLTAPRWAAKARRGKLYGEVVGIYEPGELHEMTDEQVDELIKRDLYVNAFDDQREVMGMVPYNGKNLAENIELALYCCPKCKRFGTIKSSGDSFGCDCGLLVHYPPYGFFESSDKSDPPPFETMLEWDRWQKQELERVYNAWDDPSKPLFADPGQRVYQIVSQTGATLVCHGVLSMFADRIELADTTSNVVMKFTELSDLDTVAHMDLTFSTVNGDRYEIKSDIVRSALKYTDLYEIALRKNK